MRSTIINFPYPRQNKTQILSSLFNSYVLQRDRTWDEGLRCLWSSTSAHTVGMGSSLGACFINFCVACLLGSRLICASLRPWPKLARPAWGPPVVVKACRHFKISQEQLCCTLLFSCSVFFLAFVIGKEQLF